MTSNFVGRGEEGIDASFLFLVVFFFGDTLLRGLTVLLAFTLDDAPSDPGLFAPKCAVAEDEGAFYLALGIAMAAAFVLSS